MFGYPYSYARPQSYHPSTVGYPYNYFGAQPQRPQSFYDHNGYDYDYPDEYQRRLALAEQKRRLDAEMLREEQERRRREAAYRRSFGYPSFQQPSADDEITPAQQRQPVEAQGLRRVPIKSRTPSPQPPVQEKSAPTEQPPTPVPNVISAEEQAKREQAATKIQTTYRRHRTLAAISALQTQFKKLCEEFKMPQSLDFQYEGKVSLPIVSEESKEGEVAKPTPTVSVKLGYTPNNAPLHGHIEQLNRLLIALDGVESLGDPTVRSKRKEVVKEIESEVERVEGLWRAAWQRYSS